MANEKQLAYWNEIAGPKWLKIGDAMDARFANIANLLITSAAPQPGETILDIGCGTGTTARPFAQAVAPTGHVTGIDISATMLAVARERGGNVTYQEADAQTHDFGTQTFDLLTSRFGVMFFADPYAAFKNLHACLSPTGRLCFICWSPLAQNPHWQIPFDIVRTALGDPEPRHPHAPGPMAFAEPAYIEDILGQAGFTQIAVTPTQVSITGATLESESRIAIAMGPSGALLDEKQATPETREQLRQQLAQSLAKFQTPTGLSLPATVHIVTATS